MYTDILDLKHDANDEERLFWLICQLSNKQREVLGACIDVADENGQIREGKHPSVYQHIAEITARSPGFTNTAINELLWLGLLKAESKQRYEAWYEKGRSQERYLLVGWPLYQSWHVKQILYAEKIRGKSNVVIQPQWQAALGAITQGVNHGA